jgi:Poxvirus A22 protein
MQILSIDCGLKNMGVCLLHTENNVNIELWKVFDISMTDAKKLRTDLQTHFGGALFDVVAIEQQPCTNFKMTKLQHYLEMYFACTHPQAKITIVSPRSRLSHMQKQSWWPQGEDLPKTYRERKKASVKATELFLCHHQNLSKSLEYFQSHAKKDDLSDAFLQALVISKHEN